MTPASLLRETLNPKCLTVLLPLDKVSTTSSHFRFVPFQPACRETEQLCERALDQGPSPFSDGVEDVEFNQARVHVVTCLHYGDYFGHVYIFIIVDKSVREEELQLVQNGHTHC